MQPSFVSPIRDTKTQPIMFNHMVGGLVSALLCICSPSAVAWAIPFGVVYSLNGMGSGWPASHTLVEGSKVISPLFANSNTYSTIPSIGLRFWISTPSNNAFPDFVFWKIGHPMSSCHLSHGLGNKALYRDWETDRKSTRLNSSHITRSRMPSSA